MHPRERRSVDFGVLHCWEHWTSYCILHFPVVYSAYCKTFQWHTSYFSTQWILSKQFIMAFTMASNTANGTLHTNYTKNTAHCTLHAAHKSLQTAHYTLHTKYYRQHFKHHPLHTVRRTLHTTHCKLQTTHCTLHTANFRLHTAQYTVSVIRSSAVLQL